MRKFDSNKKIAMKRNILCSTAFALIFLLIMTPVKSQTVLLYKNSFESPISAPVPNCGPDLDATLVNTLWGGTGEGTGGGGFFQQINTVETILIKGPDGQYTDPSGLGGNYCLSMLSTAEDDKAALTLNSEMLPFANITFLMSPIDIASCGGPFGVDTAVMKMTVYDSPGGVFDFFSPGTMLDETIVEGGAPDPNVYVFNWKLCSTSLDIDGSVDGYITIVFDLLQSGYAAIDSIEISSSVTAIPIEVQNELYEILVSPNPFSGELFINNTALGGHVIVSDMAGKNLMYQQASSGSTFIDVKNLPNGVYIIKYAEGNKHAVRKIIKY